jgi:DNA-binding IclR family transcriptional regulator/crotonobetainyl-CoA:carnitine CoA-transferase CaiB-like acyl-CoA transferase
MTAAAGSIRTVQRALSVLDCFQIETPRLSMHEIAQRIQLPKSTTFRILATLVAEGYLVQTERQQYALSQKLSRLGSVAQRSVKRHDVIHPVLERLASETGETVEISVLDGDSRTCIDMVESSSTLKSVVHIGIRLPLVYGATGKVFLAGLPAKEVERLVAADGGRVDMRALTAQLDEVRAHGFAFTRNERVTGAAAVAAPVTMHGDDARYCLTVTGPASRFSGREDRLRRQVLAAAAELTMRLGGREEVSPRLSQASGASPAVRRDSQELTQVHPLSALVRGRSLRHLRILDLTQDLGQASRLFRDLGATVVLVEPPAGIAARRRPPFAGERCAADDSLHFQYLSAGKCSVVMDFARAEERRFFEHVLRDTDLVIDDQPPGIWAARGLDHAGIAARHPKLVWCRVNWSAPEGAHVKAAANDQGGMAAYEGLARFARYAETGPLEAEAELALCAAAVYAAAASLTAVLDQPRDGGRFIDLSIQDVVTPDMSRVDGPSRLAAGERQVGIGLYPCRNGYVLLHATDDGWSRLVDWVGEELPEAVALRGSDWWDGQFRRTTEARSAFRSLFTRFAARRSKQALFSEGLRRGICVAPICPGTSYQLAGTPWRNTRRAPRLDEHRDRLIQRIATKINNEP